MLAVIFEMEPKIEEKEHYFDLAKGLSNYLETIDGFISVERFQSLSNPDKYLSLSFWRDEKAIEEWRNLQNHRDAQTAGRDEIFRHYRLRVCSVERDYTITERKSAPKDSLKVHDL